MATEKWKNEHVDDLRKYRRKWYKNNSKRGKSAVIERRRLHIRMMRAYKCQIGCTCGEHHPACLHFHHSKGIKEKAISRAVIWGWSWERIEAEIRKCTVMCANCHAKLHYENGTTGRNRTYKSSVLETAALPVELPS